MSHSSGLEIKRSKYRLLGLIGQGQFGQVFCAVHRPSGRFVALKNLEQERFSTHKFLRELRFLLSLQHPNIVTCQALEHTSTGRYLVMDYCESGTLRNLMREDYRLSLPYAIKIVTDILAGLAHAHSRGVVHCDIKPENILIQVNQMGWTARISDFGIARLSQEIKRQEGMTGSPAYMAPERFYGQYSESSDLYAVGILLFELIAGYRPFSGTPAELRSAHLNQPLQLAAIPELYQPIVAKALQKLSGRRFRSAEEMLIALQSVEVPQLAVPQLTDQQELPFVTITAPWRCPFQPSYQEALNQPVKALAIAANGAESPIGLSSDLSIYSIYKASPIWVSHEVRPQNVIFSNASSQLSNRSVEPQLARFYQVPADKGPAYKGPADRIEQLLIRPQGCFVVMQRSIALLPFQARTDSEAVVEANALRFQPVSLQPTARYPTALKVLAEWEHPSLVTIAPQGTWFARCCLNTDSGQAVGSQVEKLSSISLEKLAGGQNLTVASPPICLRSQIEFADILALDLRHLMVVTVSPDPAGKLGQDKLTTLRLFTRRGSRVGMLQIPLGLRRIVSTPVPYRLLGLDQQAGTILLIDLKPFRIKRLWVEISPCFLAATDWGYTVADAAGEMRFLDQTGQGIGSLTVPGTITAIAPVQQGQQGLLIATWNNDSSSDSNHSLKGNDSKTNDSKANGSRRNGSDQLYSLNLQTLGLDLIF